MNFIRIESFCSAKDPTKRKKMQTVDWEKVFVSPILNRGLVSRTYKEALKLNIISPKNLVRKRAKDVLKRTHRQHTNT